MSIRGGHGQKLSRNKERAIAALITNSSIPAAAKAAGIAEATLWRWLKIDAFKKAYRQARSEIVSHAISQLQKGLTRAIDALFEIVENSEAPASARVSAARSIIDTALKSAEMEDLVGRVEALETHIKEQKK